MSARWQVRRTIMTPKATFADFRSQRKKRCVSQSFREDYNNYIMDDSKTKRDVQLSVQKHIQFTPTHILKLTKRNFLEHHPIFSTPKHSSKCWERSHSKRPMR